MFDRFYGKFTGINLSMIDRNIVITLAVLLRVPLDYYSFSANLIWKAIS